MLKFGIRRPSLLRRRLIAVKRKTVLTAAAVKPKASPTWLEEHLNEFVKPVLGKVPPNNGKVSDDAYGHYLTQDVLQHLVDTWAAVKKYAGDRRILLPGRDAYLFEILARMEGNDKVDFRADINSTTRPRMSAALIKQYKDHFIIDSGLAGSIPKAFGSKDFRLVLYNVGDDGGKKKHQIFPDMDNALTTSPHYKLYCLLEGGSKYWQRAYGEDGSKLQDSFKQGFSQTTEFTRAAQITMIICNFLRSKDCVYPKGY